MAHGANKYPNSTLIGLLTPAMSPTDKVDSWFASSSARPSQSSTSRPNTGDRSNAFFDSTATAPRTPELLLDSSVEDQSRQPTARMNASTRVLGSIDVDQSESSTSHQGTRDPFFDSVPKGPSQLSTARSNATAPAFIPWQPTREQAPASLLKKTDTDFSPAERIQENWRPRLMLRIPNTSMSGESFRRASQLATDTEKLSLQADVPYTTDSLVATARSSTPAFQGPQRQATRRVDILNPAARPFQSKFSGPRAPPRRTYHTVMQPTEPSHTNSRVWSSKNINLAVENDRWQRVEDSLGKMNLLRSSVVPKTLKDWLAHQRGRADAKRTREQQKLDVLVPFPRDPRLPPPSRLVKLGPAFGGKSFEHKNNCAILAFPSIWARTYEPSADRPDPLWPCIEEMKEEGDERNTSGFRRFPGLPRVPGNDTVQYKLKAIQPFLPFDTIWELPTKESVEAANEKYSPEETEHMEGCLGTSLLDALNCITEDSC